MKRLLLCLLVFSFPAYAVDEMYGVISGGYSDTDFNDFNAQSAGYKFAVGYEFHPQWYVEFGYQQLASQSQLSILPETQIQLDEAEFGLEGDAIFAAVLGKAAGQMGELFYRVGVLNIDVKGQSYTTDDVCEMGNATPFTVAQTNYQFCKYDEGVVAGVIGIGFDFYLGLNTMLRTEIEHIRGQNGLRANAAYVGLRYNF